MSSQHRPENLTGKFFHIRDVRGEIDRQGEIIGSPGPGLYLCQYFGWILGQETTQEILPGDAFEGGTFYDTDQQMRDAYDASRLA